MNGPYPPTTFITAEQLMLARQVLRRGATLKQAAERAGCYAGLLDQMLWRNLGQSRRPDPMW